MNCEEFWDQAPEGWQPPGAEWAAHLDECPACAAAWAQQRRVAAGLRQVAADWSGMQAPARIEARLVNAFRAGAGLARQVRSRPWIPMLSWAAASVAVLALAFSLVRVHEPQHPVRKPIPVNAAILAGIQDMQDGAGVETVALDNGFVPLPNVEQLAPNEQGDVVTVEVPRSAMMALGFEVSPERAAEPVEAEVMFGPDGVARAVRFLDGTF